jgi:RimJ/RimL family protein N-acetyltransferase
MDDVVFRKGLLTYLRPFKKSEAPILQRGMNDPEVTQFLGRVYPVTEREEEEWLDRQSRNNTDFAFAMVTTVDNKLIGSIGLHQISWPDRTAVTGTAIWDKEYWGRGYGTDAKMLLLDYAFNALDLLIIQSKVIAFNSRSLKYAEKCGYKEVARIPEWKRGKDGNRYDEVILTVTQETWRPLWVDYLNKLQAAN